MQNFIMRYSRDLAGTLRWILVVGLVLGMVGCNAVRLGYSNGESVAYWWLNGYVDIEGDQQPLVKRHLENFFAWHRKTQLKDYAQLFALGQQRLQQQVTPADLLADYDAVKKRTVLVIDKALPDLTELALSLQPEQLEHLEKKFASNNETYRKEYLRGDLEQRQLFRFKKVMKQAEFWFGNFTEEQEAQIRAASDARPLNNELTMAQRVRRQQEMLSMLKRIQAEKPGREAALKMVRQYAVAALDYFGDPQHKAFADASNEANMRMMAVLINLATPEQKAHADKRLQQFINDCHTLANRT